MAAWNCRSVSPARARSDLTRSQTPSGTVSTLVLVARSPKRSPASRAVSPAPAVDPDRVAEGAQARRVSDDHVVAGLVSGLLDLPDARRLSRAWPAASARHRRRVPGWRSRSTPCAAGIAALQPEPSVAHRCRRKSAALLAVERKPTSGMNFSWLRREQAQGRSQSAIGLPRPWVSGRGRQVGCAPSAASSRSAVIPKSPRRSLGKARFSSSTSYRIGWCLTTIRRQANGRA